MAKIKEAPLLGQQNLEDVKKVIIIEKLKVAQKCIFFIPLFRVFTFFFMLVEFLIFIMSDIMIN